MQSLLCRKDFYRLYYHFGQVITQTLNGTNRPEFQNFAIVSLITLYQT